MNLGLCFSTIVYGGGEGGWEDAAACFKSWVIFLLQFTALPCKQLRQDI